MTVAKDQASAVVVTRGDVDLTEIAASLDGFDELIIWNNSLETDQKVYGRYAGVLQARNEVVYVQDDDCLVHFAGELLLAYKPDSIAANMPVSRWTDYPDSCLVGWGAVFHRDLPERAFDLFAEHVVLTAPDGDRVLDDGRVALDGDRFLRTADVVFTTLTPHRKYDLGFQHLPPAEDPARAMFKQPGHKQERDEVLELARTIRDGRRLEDSRYGPRETRIRP